MGLVELFTLLTPSLRKELAGPLPGSGGQPWAQLVAKDGYTTVALIEDQNEIPDQSWKATRTVVATVTRRDAQGKAIGAPDQYTFTINLSREASSGPWLVNSIATN